MLPNSAIVIGAGIAGCSTAYSLAQRGVKVMLLERRASIAAEASGNSLAMLYPRLSGNNPASQFALAGYLYSLKLFNKLHLSTDDFNTCGLLQLGHNSRELARIKKVVTLDYPATVLKYVSQQEASKLSGIQLLHDALYFPNGAWVKPQSLCHHLINHQNIELLTLTDSDKILKNNELFEVIINNHHIKKADIVIIANANDAQYFMQSSHIITQAVRGQVTQLSANEASKNLRMIVCSEGYFCPAVNHQHSLGATFSKETCLNNHDDLILEDHDHLANLRILNTISSNLHLAMQANIVGGRAALRCTTPDYFPLVGALLDGMALKALPPRPTAKAESLPWLKGLYINVAHGSRGFTSAPLCAEILARSICNEPVLDATTLISADLVGLMNPNRFLLRELGLKRLSKLPT